MAKTLKEEIRDILSKIQVECELLDELPHCNAVIATQVIVYDEQGTVIDTESYFQGDGLKLAQIGRDVMSQTKEIYEKSIPTQFDKL
jgi:hypothetical protein